MVGVIEEISSNAYNDGVNAFPGVSQVVISPPYAANLDNTDYADTNIPPLSFTLSGNRRLKRHIPSNPMFMRVQVDAYAVWARFSLAMRGYKHVGNPEQIAVPRPTDGRTILKFYKFTDTPDATYRGWTCLTSITPNLEFGDNFQFQYTTATGSQSYMSITGPQSRLGYSFVYTPMIGAPHHVFDPIVVPDPPLDENPDAPRPRFSAYPPRRFRF